jgi:hypothetical protein
MERLGAAYVTHRLRAEKFIQLASGGQVSIKQSLEGHYLKLVDELVEEARYADAQEF